MNLDTSKRAPLLIILTLLLIGSAIVGGYYLFLQPLNEKLERKQTEWEMASQELTILENKLAEMNEQTVNNSMELQKKIPVKRLLEQVFLDIEKAETVSGTKITTINMRGTEEVEGTEEEQEQNRAEETEDETDEEAQPPAILEGNENRAEVIQLPGGMQKTDLTISGEADTYFVLESFVNNLQGLQRIMKIEHLSFDGLDEPTKVEEINQDPITFQLTIASFSYPKLEDLRAELPPIDTPQISNKKNPLNSTVVIEK